MSHPRLQQHKHLVGALAFALASFVLLANAGSMVAHKLPDGLVESTVLMAGLAAYLARRSYRVSKRHRVGAESEDAVRRRLGWLAAEGWSVRNSVVWAGGGDIDHLATSPDGLLTAVIETKTRSYTTAHLERLRLQAADVSEQLSPECLCVSVLCLVGQIHVHCYERDVVVVSLEALQAALWLMHEEALAYTETRR